LIRWADYLEEKKEGNKAKGWDYDVKPYIPKY